MGTITVTKTRECADGTHLTISITGDYNGTFNFYAPDLMEPITNEDREAFLRVLLRLCKKGKTMAQVKNALNNGITVSI